MARRSTEAYKFKKLLDHLSHMRGRHTELVSVYVPSGYDINKVVGQIRDEQGTASNIKSTSTRKNVLSALERILQHFTLFKQTPPNGLVIFCGNISEKEGNPDIELFSFEPLEPLTVRVYRCDQTFVLEPLLNMLEVKEVYGLLIIERNEATIGMLRGKKIEVCDTMYSGAPGKIRAGGQSSVRFARLREIADHEFKKRVGEHANRIFLNEKNLAGIIVGGPGQTKEKFLEGDYLYHELRGKIIGMLDTAYNGEFGLKELADKAKEILQDLDFTKEREYIQHFLQELVNDGPVAYGEKEVRYALDIGAVDTLLLSEGLDKYRIKIRCDACGYEEEKTIAQKDLEALKSEIQSTQCPQCSNIKLVVAGEKELVEELSEKADEKNSNVEVISTDTDEGTQLYRGFGGIAALLRYTIK
jgi:peptide chain release factor subunit 1